MIIDVANFPQMLLMYLLRNPIKIKQKYRIYLYKKKQLVAGADSINTYRDMCMRIICVIYPFRISSSYCSVRQVKIKSYETKRTTSILVMKLEYECIISVLLLVFSFLFSSSFSTTTGQDKVVRTKRMTSILVIKLEYEYIISILSLTFSLRFSSSFSTPI